MEDTGVHLNGYKIRSWGDLAALSSLIGIILTLFVSCLFWGLKLESELNVERQVNSQQAERIASLEAQVNSGILSISRSEIDNLKDRMARHEDNDHD
jgi:hypothetical protein